MVVVGDGTAAAATTGDGVAVGGAGLGAVVAGLGAGRALAESGPSYVQRA